MARESHVQYFVYNKRTKIARGPRSVINQPRWIQDAFDELTEKDGDPSWIGGSLEKILRTPDVDRTDVARALGLMRD